MYAFQKTPTGEPAIYLLESEPAQATDLSLYRQLASLIMNNFLLFCQEKRQRHDSGALKLNYCLCLSLPSQMELSAAAASAGRGERSQKWSCSSAQGANTWGSASTPCPALWLSETRIYPDKVPTNVSNQTTSRTELSNCRSCRPICGSWK